MRSQRACKGSCFRRKTISQALARQRVPTTPRGPPRARGEPPPHRASLTPEARPCTGRNQEQADRLSRHPGRTSSPRHAGPARLCPAPRLTPDKALTCRGRVCELCSEECMSSSTQHSPERAAGLRPLCSLSAEPRRQHLSAGRALITPGSKGTIITPHRERTFFTWTLQMVTL